MVLQSKEQCEKVCGDQRWHSEGEKKYGEGTHQKFMMEISLKFILIWTEKNVNGVVLGDGHFITANNTLQNTEVAFFTPGRSKSIYKLKAEMK